MKKLTGIFLAKVLVIIFIKDTIESFGDLFFKKGAVAPGIHNLSFPSLFEFALKVTLNPWLWLGALFYLANFFIWIALLSRVDLSVAFPMSSMTYIIVPALAIIFLHETVVGLRWAGIILIIIGITLVSKSAQKE